MSSISEIAPVKLFVSFLEGQSLEERLAFEFGPVDHRSSVIPLDGAIHRVFLSFERLVKSDGMPEAQGHVDSIEKEFHTVLNAGFLDNRRVVIAMMKNAAHRFELGNNIFGEESIQFKSSGAQFLPWTHMDFQSDISREFFLTMRKLYREQLRSMCMLRR